MATLASVLEVVTRGRSELACAIAVCDECGRAEATGARSAVGLAALKLYTLEEPGVYAEVNAAMRSNDADALEPYGRFVRTMLEAMLACPRFEGPTVYRGVRLDMRAACRKGETLVWREFASCTSAVETQEAVLGRTGDRTLFVVTLTQGRARSIADVSMMPGEGEVLLPPGTRATVDSVYNAGNGLLVVSVTEKAAEAGEAGEAGKAVEAVEAGEAKKAGNAERRAERISGAVWCLRALRGRRHEGVGALVF
jgi:ribosomal protein L34E